MGNGVDALVEDASISAHAGTARSLFPAYVKSSERVCRNGAELVSAYFRDSY
jgi:hypothetical protein